MIRWAVALTLMTWPALAQTPRDLGAHGDGSGSDTAAFQRAQDVEQALGGGTVRVSPGLYSLGTNAYTAGRSPGCSSGARAWPGPGSSTRWRTQRC